MLKTQPYGLWTVDCGVKEENEMEMERNNFTFAWFVQHLWQKVIFIFKYLMLIFRLVRGFSIRFLFRVNTVVLCCWAELEFEVHLLCRGKMVVYIQRLKVMNSQNTFIWRRKSSNEYRMYSMLPIGKDFGTFIFFFFVVLLHFSQTIYSLRKKIDVLNPKVK